MRLVTGEVDGGTGAHGQRSSNQEQYLSELEINEHAGTPIPGPLPTGFPLGPNEHVVQIKHLSPLVSKILFKERPGTWRFDYSVLGYGFLSYR